MSQKPKLVWTEVDSSNVKAVAHNPVNDTLAVQFSNGGLYTYEGVDEEVYVSLVHAASVGQYLNLAIKGVYPYTKHFTQEALEQYMLQHQS